MPPREAPFTEKRANGADKVSTRRNTFYNVGYRVFSVLLPLVTAPYLSRTVGRAGVGLYAYAWSVSYVFCLIGMLGLNDYGVREIARVRDNPEALNRTFSEIWQMQRLVAGVTLLGWGVYVGFIAEEEQLIALHLTMMSVSCLVNLDWCLMGLDQFRPIALRNTAVKLLAAAAVFLFVKGPEDLWIYAFAWSLSTLLGCVSCWSSLRGKVKPVRVTLRAALRHLRPCSVLFVSVIAVTVYRTMDKVMVGAIAGMAENGLYENAEKIVYCLSGFISAIGTVMLPRASALQKAGKRDAILRQMDMTMQGILCMVCAMAFGLCAVADRFCVLFYGEDFAGSGPMMKGLGFSLILIGFANVVRTQWILPQERDRIVLRSVLCGAVVNFAVNSLLIPRLGGMGAVIGTLCAEAAVPLTQAFYLWKELPYPRYLRQLLTCCAVGLVMMLAVRAADGLIPGTGWLHLGIVVAIGAAVYGVLTLLVWKLTGSSLLRLAGRRLGGR